MRPWVRTGFRGDRTGFRGLKQCSANYMGSNRILRGSWPHCPPSLGEGGYWSGREGKKEVAEEEEKVGWEGGEGKV